MSFFAQNLESLRRTNPDLAEAVRVRSPESDIRISLAKSGDKVPVVEGRALHSTYFPLEEADRFAAVQSADRAGAAIVLGLGFGYHIQALLKRGCRPLILVEKSLDLLKAAMQEMDLVQILSETVLLCDAPPAAVVTCDALDSARDTGAYHVIPHEPSVRLSPEYYAAVKSQVARGIPSLQDSPLRVLVVSPVLGGSWPIARYAASGLEQAGCKADFLDLSPFRTSMQYLQESLKNTTLQEGMAGLFERLLCEFVYCKVRQLRPELVLFLAQAPAGDQLLLKLRQEGLRTAFWFVENYRLFPYWSKIAPLCDYFFTIQRGEFFSRLDDVHAFNHFYLPLACEPSVHRPLNLDHREAAEYASDVSIAGFGYYNRLHTAQGLTEFSLKLWGPGWDRASVLTPYIQRAGAEFDAETMVKIYCSTAVNLNLHSSTYSTGIEPDGDFVNPRTFELAGCGAFQLVDPRSELNALFRIGQELQTFSDLEDLRHKIRHYLKHPRERAGFSEEARRRALAEHTYARRMRQMLSCIYPEQWLQRRLCRPSAPDEPARLLRETPGDHPLFPLLNSFPAESRVTVQGLIDRLGGSGGPPSPEEITLRWMDNIQKEGRRK